MGEVARDATTTDALKDSGPFGGCEPIGMTASGELVFPLDCKKAIKKPAAAPVAEDKPPGDDKTAASTDAKPNLPSQAGVADTPATAETKPAGEATAQAPATPSESKPPETSDRAGPAQKAAADSVAGAKPGTGKAATSKTAASKAASGKTMPDNAGASHSTPSNMQPGRAASGKTAAAIKDLSVKGGQPATPKGAASEGKEASKRTTASDKKPMIVMAKPVAATTAVAGRRQAEETPRLRTAGMPACVQFRSYNPTTRSYRGFDGHVYECK
ncbi:hypothetical protein [Bradyrhizobium sp. USDA 4369]